ncbi:MAG: hypothetical protein WC716_16650 [Chitinophagaceae bacterium]|jgi:hypothetical protein
MKKILLATLTLIFALSADSATWRNPKNIRIEACTVYVAANSTVYSKKFTWAGDAWKIGKVAIQDTNLVDQDTINIGSGATGGVEIKQRICTPFGNLFGYDSLKFDTLCTICGDTTLIAFTNAEGLSKDSMVCAAIDTSKMILTSLGGDSLWISKGYFSLLPDPSPMTDFQIKGNSGFGATVKRIIMMFWVFDKIPAGDIN